MLFTDKELLVNETIRHYYPDAIQEDLITLKNFVEERYEEKGIYEQYSVLYGYWDLPKEEQMKIAHLMCDLTDFYLRVVYDEI